MEGKMKKAGAIIAVSAVIILSFMTGCADCNESAADRAETEELVTNVLNTPQEYVLSNDVAIAVNSYKSKMDEFQSQVDLLQHNLQDLRAAIAAELKIFLAYKGVPREDFANWHLQDNKVVRIIKVKKKEG